MITRFDAVPIGGRFEFRGRRYEKMAGSIACDEDRFGNNFHPGTEVVCASPAPPRPLPLARPNHPVRKHHRIWADPK